MSSSKPHKSCSGSVHDSDSESSIEYVQTQSPLSPNIPLTTPIASSMNVSGPNIDVGNLKAQTSSIWSIQFPQIPLIHKCMCLRDQKVHLNIHQRLIPNQNFHVSSLLIQVHVGDEKRVDGGKRKRPLENFTRSGLSEGDPGLTLHQNMALKGNSSREKIMDDEDENMSLTQSETNDEPRRDNFTEHEQGTQSKSELTHPQMPLAQSILDQSKMRQRRNQACKAHDVAKCASQKEEQKWLKAEIPENVHGMRSAVHAHCLFLLKVRDKDFSSLPAPPSTEEREIGVQVDGHLRYVPKDVFNEPSTQVQFQGFQSYCKNELHKLGLK
ncbi:hypothetical protein O181_103966 [Austropuccinia psidii MF-1]|uniref:Uncharacterized protein n=1 Tax=Austropuccinia psidii MF-1 TaxID=1389203 RepID=A0A9Q3JLP8_9BASI|nr:hypothetical protein [Austropuccinia psidii MF-1]